MLTGEDIGKRTIVFNTLTNRWDPTVYHLAAIDSSTGYGYLEAEGKRAWRWLLKNIRVLDGY